MPYNILSCSGWEASQVARYFTGGDCLKARIGIVILFFLVAIIRKWGGEEMGLDFSFLWGLLGGIVGYLIIVSIFGNPVIAFIVGLVASLAAGYGLGAITGGSEGY